MSEKDFENFVENEVAAQDDLLELLHEINMHPFRMSEGEVQQ